VILDIGSGSVGGAVVLSSPKISKPKILYTFRTPIVLAKNLNFERFSSVMLAALKDVLVKIEQNKAGAPENIFCFLASPWTASQTRTIKLKKNSPFRFTKELARNFVEKEIRNFQNTHLKRFEQIGSKMRLLEKEYFQIKLNGYKTNNPLGKRSGDFEIDLFVSIAPEKILGLIEYQIRKFFNLPIHFHSFIFPSFLIIRDLFPKCSDYIFMDIAGEITDVSIVKNDILTESVSFPVGKSFLTATLAERLNKSSMEAGSILNLFLENKLEEKLVSKVNEILSEVKKTWLKSFDEALAKISGGLLPPSTIFVTVDPDVSKFFEQTIAAEEWGQFALANNKFNVIIINNRILSSAISILEKAALDPFLSLESIYTNKIKNI